MIRAIIFDFFDVIYNDPYNAWLENHGYTREGDFLIASQKMDSGQIDIDEFFDLLSALSSQPVDLVNKEFRSVSQTNYKVLEIIKSLKLKYKIGLLSNSPSEFIREILEENNLDKYFDEIVISSEVGKIKPDKAIFDIIINRLDIKPSETLFIDDNGYYIEGAKKAGLNAIQFIDASQLAKDLTNII